MNTDIQNLWDSCLENIRGSVSERVFKTWFKPIVPLALNQNVLTVQLPNEFFYDFLEEHYVEVLKSTIKGELGPRARLEYKILLPKEKARPPASSTVRKKKSADLGKEIKNPFVIPGIKKMKVESQLVSKYTFDDFIEGDCNKLARSAGIAIARKPGETAFNPLVVYGKSGLGKTHLVHAVGNEVKSAYPDKKVLYVSTEKFTNQVYQSIKANNTNELVAFYQELDVFILDDIHFLARREKTQEILFHIFNQIHQNGKQIILTSDRPPKDLEGMEDRLITRFKWGLSADLTPPDFETRMVIALQKLELENVEIPTNVLEYICYNIKDNIRELEGYLTSLIFQASVTQTEVDLKLAEKVMHQFIEKEEREVSVENIKKLVCESLGLDLESVQGKSRKREIVSARQIGMYLSKNFTSASYKEIGRCFGGRDHSTVIHSYKTIQDQIETNEVFSDKIKKLEKDIQLSFMK
nr:chromosomal replication initiator protein DnaA [Saprospiraceae bacterium]